MTFREAYDKAMPEKKRREERFNLFAHWVGRPVSLLMTLPLVNTKIRPITVTFFSLIASITGFGFVAFGKTMLLKLIGWCFFFLWNLLDGVDGNLARCTNQCSPIGGLWDSTVGYAAMVLTYFSAGIAAFYDTNIVEFIEPYWYLIIGGATAVFSIFPRLVMHKKKSMDMNADTVKTFSDKEHFGIKRIIAMNLISPSGFMQVILLLSIVFHVLNLFILTYMFINFGIMIMSLFKILKD